MAALLALVGMAMGGALSLPELAVGASARFGSRPALSRLGAGGWTLSFEELARTMAACAIELAS